MRNLLYVCIAGLLLSSCGKKEEPMPQDPEKTCLTDPNYKCWCSQICGFRKKEKEDHPIYIENDPNGKFCYCKKWDYDYYDENCVDGENIKQPPNAE